eukprot:GEMP01085325.1.p2 GENE.GEMP01085325.1~~GEMP01085325.1.p2  ORF type:complete len:153 (+),score=44.68 GEMP01085325.1:125-583(+)
MGLLSKILVAAAAADGLSSSTSGPHTTGAADQPFAKDRKIQGTMRPDKKGKHKKGANGRDMKWVQIDDKWERVPSSSLDNWGGMWRVNGKKQWVRGRWTKSGRYWKFVSVVATPPDASGDVVMYAPPEGATRPSPSVAVTGPSPPVLPEQQP